ncbi:autotransporter outer membrane beta-barrel domain-containing protein [Candidatus Pelagibacter ubique]|nr:autotransporter outer membrane beta-barrel domain-containing protein [Candidatus Pelagibacter ubique]
MKFIKNFILILLFILPISNSFGAMVTFVDSFQVSNGESQITDRAGLATDTDREIGGVQFNDDGTKMFVRFFRDEDGGASPDTELYSYIDQYNLSTPFDASTGTYAVSCELNHGQTKANGNPNHEPFDLNFSSDGMKFYVANRNRDSANSDRNFVYRFDLTTPYDISDCSYAQKTENLGNFINGSQAGDRSELGHRTNLLQGVSLSNDGKKMFTLMAYGVDGGHVLEYDLSTAFDVTTFSLNLNGGMDLSSDANNPQSIEFSEDGTRIFIANHGNQKILQISLNAPFDTSSYTVDGAVAFNTSSLGGVTQMRTVTFSKNGLIMYIGNDDSGGNNKDRVHEYNLVCPFNIIEGKCPPVTENSVRTGIAIAQIEVATRTIEHSTDTALNRLKWIRRNKDNQNLTNLNLDLNFTNQMLASLTKVVKTSATTKKKEEKQQDVFYWSEGSIAVGRVGDTSVSSFKKIKTNAITVGADKFTRNNGIRGLAFRFGKNDIDVGSAGSNLDTNTYNLTHYTSSPIEDDTKFIDTVFGIGVLNSDILSVLDGKRSTAERNGKQIYGTIKLKDEIKKNNLILVPSAQIDLGYTLLNDYQESGNAAMKFKKQGIQSRNARLSIAAVEELENEKYKIRKHGKLEYKANLRRSSNIKYSYVSDATSGEFDTKLNSGALHNLNGELGIDIILPDSFSIFLIYERNQALGTGHTDKIHLAIGYLPNRKTNYAFKLVGSENLGSEFKISKNINDFEIDFKLNNQDALKPNIIDEATVNLKKIF